MRAGDNYTCSKCTLGGPREALCEPRCERARDANGNAPPPPSSDTYEWYGGNVTQAGPILLRSAMRLAFAIRRTKRRRKLRALFDAAGPVVPIAFAPTGLVAIEGRVELLEPTTTPGGEPVAAFIDRHVTFAHHAGARNTTTRVERVEVRRAAGRFLVRDETGAALVDDDWLLLLDASGDELDASEAGQLVVGEGQVVRVVGHCRPGDRLVPSEASSFRGHARGIEMIGGTGRPVCVLPRSDASNRGTV